MTDRAAFKNPPLAEPSLSANELQTILNLQKKMLCAAMTSRDYHRLLDEVCHLAESITTNSVATVMVYDPERNGLFVESAPSLDREAIQAFNGLQPGEGSCGNAVYHNDAMYVCNAAEDERWKNVSHLARRFGIRSCFSFPIQNVDGAAIGSFAISSFQPKTPDGFHQTLLDICACICGLILQRQSDDRQRRKLLEERIRDERVESLGVLAGGIAHDFNNLLTIMMGSMDLAASQVPPGPAHDALDVAIQGAEQARKLTEQLRAMSRGNSPIRVPNDIGHIISESVAFALRGSNVSWQLSGLDALNSPVINVDGAQIGRLIQNLVLNARQAMPTGGNIRIHCEEVDNPEGVQLPAGHYLKMTVSDNGPGIPPDALDKVLDPYFTTRPEGSGLGLFICWSIVRNHGGHIAVESEPGQGTRIIIHLPHARPAVAACEAKPLLSADRLQPSNVLIMDDDDLIRRILRTILEQMGCRVWDGASGQEVVKRFDELQQQGIHVDVCILDLTIPGGMGGVETRDELRRRDPDIKTVLSTGYAMDGADNSDGASGFDAALMKPYRIATVRTVLHGLQSNSRPVG